MENGKHLGGYKYRNRRSIATNTRNSVIGTIITALAGTVIKDLTSNDSKIKKLMHIFHPAKQLENNVRNKNIIDVDYSIIENDNKEIMEK